MVFDAPGQITVSGAFQKTERTLHCLRPPLDKGGLQGGFVPTERPTPLSNEMKTMPRTKKFSDNPSLQCYYALLAAPLSFAAERARIDLNGQWQFRLDPRPSLRLVVCKAIPGRDPDGFSVSRCLCGLNLRKTSAQSQLFKFLQFFLCQLFLSLQIKGTRLQVMQLVVFAAESLGFVCQG